MYRSVIATVIIIGRANERAKERERKKKKKRDKTKMNDISSERKNQPCR